MPATFSYTFDTAVYKGTSTLNTGLFIGGKWVEPVEQSEIEIINPATGRVITSVAAGSAKDVDIAVAAARKAFRTSWGLKCPGSVRGKLLNKLADLVEQHADELAALEALDVGKVYGNAKAADVGTSLALLRYYAGWADKVHGKTIETDESKLAYTRHEPFGVVGQIIPWNLPLLMVAMKVAPALATGNTVILKPSEITPLTALRFADFVNEAGFPPGVVNIINGYGDTVGNAISYHPNIDKIAFTGSTLTGRKVMKAAAESNLKVVSLELGGKSPTIIFDDADLEQAVKWAAHGIYYNMGQACIAGSRIFVQEGIYDRFLTEFTKISKALSEATGDPFTPGTLHGPQVSQAQFDRVMSYIDSGIQDGATVHLGGDRYGDEGYFIQPTIFTNAKPEMKIVQEEIFGPVAAVIPFKTEEGEYPFSLGTSRARSDFRAEVIEAANNSIYGLACNIFSENIGKALRVAHQMESGQAWINSALKPEVSVPFGGYKQSGMGREMGEYALETYTQVKAIHVNIGQRI